MGRETKNPSEKVLLFIIIIYKLHCLPQNFLDFISVHFQVFTFRTWLVLKKYTSLFSDQRFKKNKE